MQQTPLDGPPDSETVWDGEPPAGSVHSQGRRARYAEYAAFYRGDQWPDLPAPGERRLTFNYARVFVNKAASYLLGKPVGYDATALETGPGGASAGARGMRRGRRAGGEARAVEAYLEAVAAFNHLAALDLAEIGRLDSDPLRDLPQAEAGIAPVKVFPQRPHMRPEIGHAVYHVGNRHRRSSPPASACTAT